MQKPVLSPAAILLPAKDCDWPRWAALACDQFTSEPGYWQEAESFTGEAPGTLRITLPEVYLEQPGCDERIADIHTAMGEYTSAVLTREATGYIYVERTLQNGAVRQGIVGCIDLEDYSYLPGAATRIRPSEETIVERIPPRLAVRRGAPLETPHILMLANDPQKTLIEPLAAEKASMPLLYDFDLMLGGGHIRGWEVSDPDILQRIAGALAQLEEPENFYTGCGIAHGEAQPFALAVGDGNHSLATAKAYWEEIKTSLPPALQENHPARFCLVEVENIHSEAIEIEPIHRVVFGVRDEDMLQGMTMKAQALSAKVGPYGQEDGQSFVFTQNGVDTKFSISQMRRPLAVGTVDYLLDALREDFPAMKIDYIHGEASVRQLAQEGALGILLPSFEKRDLFRGVALGGVLPRKTFSMGHAREKRYYLECRRISPE